MRDNTLSQYEDVDGVEVLEGKDDINKALEQLESDVNPRYRTDTEVVLAALEKDNQYPDIDVLEKSNMADKAADLFETNVPGVYTEKTSVPRV